MQQTLLALLALLVVTLLNFSQMKTTVENERMMVKTEMQQMALGVATDVMEIVRARAYDDATEGIPRDSVMARSDFTSAPFPTGNHCKVFGGSDVCDDVDDFHEMVPATVPFELPNGKMDFAVEIEVQYVDSTTEPTGGATTRWKEVTIYVQDLPSSGDPQMSVPIQFSEVVSR